MTILFSGRPSVNPHFGAGVEPVTIERNLSPATVPATPSWELEVRACLSSVGYASWPTSHVIGAIRDGQPVASISGEILDPDDRVMIRLILARHGMEPRRRNRPFEPSEADRLEWARDMNGDYDN